MDEKKITILEIATTLFLEKGFHNTSVQDIAMACNISKATIYKYFSSKEDISLAIILRSNYSLIQSAREVAASTVLSDREKLYTNILALIKHLLPNPRFTDALYYAFSPEQKTQYMPIISKIRFHLFCEYAQCISNAFLLDNESVAWELTINLTGLLKELAFLTPQQDGLVLDHKAIADFIIDSLEAIATKRHGTSPLMPENYLQELKNYYAADKQPNPTPICQRAKLLEKLRNQVTQESPHDLRKDLFDAITLLEQEYQKPLPKFLIIDALFAYLNQRKELATTVARLKALPQQNALDLRME